MVEDNLTSVKIKTNQQGHAVYKHSVTTPGNIAIETTINENGKEYTSVGGFIWVCSADKPWTDGSWYNDNYGSIKLVPDKKSYRAGETARVLAILPHEGANLLVTTELETVMST